MALSPGLGQGSSSGTTARSRAHSSPASALSLPCPGQSVWGEVTRTKRQWSQLFLEACQPSTNAADGRDQAWCWEPKNYADKPQCAKCLSQEVFSIMFQKLSNIFGSLSKGGKVQSRDVSDS